MRIPASIVKLIKLFFLLLLMSVLFANSILVIAALIPLFFLLSEMVLSVPSKIKAVRILSRDKIYSGDLLEVRMELVLENGIGVIQVADKLPENFELVEGSNFRVFWHRPGIDKAVMRYTVRCLKSGTYTLESLNWESIHSLTGRIATGCIEEPSVIQVLPGKLEVERLKSSAAVTRIPMPEGNLARMGIPTLEFKEIRLYTPGDNFRSINWKATARNIHRGHVWPVINEYDKEGKKVVWIFLDRSSTMEYGSSVKNAMEYSIEAASGLGDFYLRQNCSVGLCTFNGRMEQVFPGTGKRQYFKLLELLSGINSNVVDVDDRGFVTLDMAVAMHKRHLNGVRPLFIVITRSNKDQYENLADGIMEMCKYTAGLNGHYDIMIINIGGYELAVKGLSEQLAGEILHIWDQMKLSKLKERCRWVEWNPAKTGFASALLK